jgi:hypothetical protein
MAVTKDGKSESEIIQGRKALLSQNTKCYTAGMNMKAAARIFWRISRDRKSCSRTSLGMILKYMWILKMKIDRRDPWSKQVMTSIHIAVALQGVVAVYPDLIDSTKSPN